MVHYSYDKVFLLEDRIVEGQEITVKDKHEFFDENVVLNFWEGFFKEHKGLSRSNNFYGLCFDFDPGTFEHRFAIAARQGVIKSDNLIKYKIPAGEYAKFKYIGNVQDKKKVNDFYDMAFDTVSSYINYFSNLNSFELYEDDYIHNNDVSAFYLYVPLVR